MKNSLKKARMWIAPILVCSLIMTLSARAQIYAPVIWEFTAVKAKDKTFNVRMTATLEPGWHIYSQHTPAGGPLPTAFVFDENPALVPEGEITEEGEPHFTLEEVFGVDVHYYNDSVSFVQRFTLNGDAPATVSGTVEFMVCNDQSCMPPAKETFEVTLDGAAGDAELFDFRSSTPEGDSLSLATFAAGHALTLVDFWASWCKPCRAEHGDLKALYSTYKGKELGIISVSLDSDRKAWEKALLEDDLPWEQVSSLQGFKEPAAQQLGIRAIPARLLVDRQGRIVAHDLPFAGKDGGTFLRGEHLEVKVKELMELK